MKRVAVAIDGPAGAGKSTISKMVAKELGFIYIDTGAMYRAIGLKALNHKYDTKQDIDKIIEMAEHTDIDIQYLEGVQNIFLDGENVTGCIRTNEVSIAASDVSAIPKVRLILVALQQKLAEKQSVIMDGRDIGTFVLPNADVKIFLTASIEDRARRRYEELLEKGMSCDFETLKEEIALRDTNDSTRKFAPLKPAEDAIILDTSNNELEQSISLVLHTIKERL